MKQTEPEPEPEPCLAARTETTESISLVGAGESCGLMVGWSLAVYQTPDWRFRDNTISIIITITLI